MLVERRDELTLLSDLYADCATGRGRVALISGGLASGKTALLHAFAEQAVERGALLLTATAARAEQALRMGVVWQLFRGAQLPPGVLDRVSLLISAEPLVAADAETDQTAVPQADARAVHGICALLLGLAGDRPVVLAVDDVQFADAASLQVLRYLRRRMRPVRMLLALTEWERPSLVRPVPRAEVTRQPHQRIAIGPLSTAGVAELVGQRIGRGAVDRLAPAYLALGGGNPYLTNALIEDHGRAAAPAMAGADRGRPVVGPAFQEAVLDCLHRWDPEFIRVASGMAILGDRATPELVGELTGIQPHSAGQVSDVLAAAGLAMAGRLRRAEVVATVLESLDPAQRSRLHAKAAELLYRAGADAVEVAEQVMAADEVPGPWAVRLLRHAADQALADDAGLAVRYLELAMRGCADEPEQLALRAALVRVAWRVNPSAAARHLVPLQDALGAGELGWRDAVPVLRHLLWQGDLGGVARQLGTVHTAAGQPDARIAAELRLAAEWIYGEVSDRMPAEVRGWLTGASTGTGGAPPANPWRRTAALHTAWSGGSTDEVAGDAEHVLQGCLGDVLPEVGAAALLALEYADRQQRAVFWCEALFGEATRQRATTWRAVLGCVRAELAWRRGDLAAARAQAGAALDLLHTQSWGVLVGFPLSVLVLASTAMGDHDAAAELLDRAVPEAMLDTAFGLRYLHASGHYHLASGRPHAALDDFERCGALVRAHGLDLPAMVPWRSDLAQARLRLGMRREARDLVVEQLGRPRVGVGLRARAVSLRVLAACGELAESVPLLRDAVRLLERCGDRLELARALMALSQAHRELGDLVNARLVLRRADQVAKGCQAKVVPSQHSRRGQDRAAVVPPADVPAAGVGVSNGRASGSADATALSEAERKVAALAAHGHTNREIGRKLYITVSTVEQHLTRVYRKLKVTSRTDLPAELSRLDALYRLAVGIGSQ